MRKEILEKRRDRLTERRDGLKAKALASDDAAEVRSINEQIADINDQLADIEDDLKLIEEDETRSAPPADAKLVNGNLVGSFAAPGEEKREEDPFASMEYRKAFMAYAQRGAAIPAKFEARDGAAANTTSLGATIPTTVLNEFINTIRKRYGNLYAKVRKTNFQGAVKIPIADMQAQFKWVTEDTVSPRQNGGSISDYVEFSYNMAEIRVAQSFLSAIVTLDLFEREIVRIMLIAYMQAMDTGIVKGTGIGQMLGILNDPRVTSLNHVVEFKAAQMSDWTYWRKNFFAQLPLGYRDGEFIFSMATVDAYLETMADSNNNPIFRQATGLEVNDGDARNPNGRFFGRDISLVEPDILPDFDSASDGDVIGIFWQPDEYAINTNMAFGMERYKDQDRNEWVNKMLTVVDGKVLNPNGFWLLKKKV